MNTTDRLDVGSEPSDDAALRLCELLDELATQPISALRERAKELPPDLVAKAVQATSPDGAGARAMRKIAVTRRKSR